MKCGAEKRKEEAQQQLQSSAAVQKADRNFAASITLTNNNLAETGQSVMLYQ